MSQGFNTSDTMVVFPKFQGRKFKDDPSLCFVLMPFGYENLDDIYKTVIKPVVKRNNLQCIRADEVSSHNRIMEDIWRKLCEAKIVICDLTHGNPNVYYELGMCHVLGKNTILISQESKIPFDIHSWRCIIYSDKAGKTSEFTDKLDDTIKKILAESELAGIDEPEKKAEIFSASALNWEAASIYLGLSKKHGDSGDVEAQAAYMEKAISELQKGSYPWETAENLIKLANLYEVKGSIQQKLKCLARAADVYRLAQEHWESAQMYFKVAEHHKLGGGKDLALRFFKLAKKQYEIKGYKDEIEMCNSQISHLQST